MPYSPPTLTGYNANPPEDDGTQVATNQATWDGIKTKLGDPLKTYLDDTQTAIDAVIDTIEADIIVAGTKMLFVQTAAPTGWTKDTDQNDKALRIVSGAASTGGSTAFSSIFASRTILLANLPSTIATVASDAGATTNVFCSSNCPGATANAITALAQEVVGGSGTAMDFAVQYVDVIKATKD